MEVYSVVGDGRRRKVWRDVVVSAVIVACVHASGLIFEKESRGEVVPRGVGVVSARDPSRANDANFRSMGKADRHLLVVVLLFFPSLPSSQHHGFSDDELPSRAGASARICHQWTPLQQLL